MKYTGDGQVVPCYDPNGMVARIRVPIFGGDVLHVVRKYDDKTGRLLSEDVELTSVAKDAGWRLDEPPAKKKKSKKE